MSEDTSRARLGRGLASLIGAGGTAGAGPRTPLPFAGPGGAGERKVEIGRLSPNPKNPRRQFTQADLDDLTASIKVHGVVQPILVRQLSGGETGYEIVAGERRWRAAKAAGLSEVPVVVRAIGDRESLEIAIIENVQRADLNAIEEARGYQMLVDEHAYTQADLAEVLGKSRSHVANTLRLLKLPEAVLTMVERGELSAGAARTAVSMDDPEAFARRIADGGLSVREAEEAARTETAAPPKARPRGAKAKTPQPVAPVGVMPAPQAPAVVKDADTLALEALLTEALSMPVSIDLAGRGGRLSLSFADLDQLDDICRLLQARRTASEPRIREL
ncbi:ParB/RepB/Spo0J family partition protein [Aureimonas mangrovi]|uniref:ParB/RepB/Spo0J family partition protein n=1 Tax=Aureimonas mangrovi TaxID=2758041 RepID=UPI00163D69C5|nr:ParB/RepB/Spo0J family partition protein [Aureimonas mangrovi]